MIDPENQAASSIVVGGKAYSKDAIFQVHMETYLFEIEFKIVATEANLFV